MNAALKPVPTILVTQTVAETALAVRALQEELNDLFPERESLITLLGYGLLTREHLLVYGKFGTGKSRLVELFFGAFTDSELFSLELTKFMTESNVVGIPNPKLLREEGRLWHEREGTMLDADFVELDEFFDANDLLLRVLLGILNERRFKRGRQFERANLHMALASTNGLPEAEVKRSPQLGAVVDRFLFQTQVEYLTRDDSRRRMYTKYLGNARPTVTIPFASMTALAQAVRDIPINDPVLVELHNQIVQGMQKELKRTFSDRRACQALKLAQANALLFGRSEVLPDDFMAIQWALTYGHDTKNHDVFKSVAVPLIDKAISERKPDIVRTQMKLLDEFERRIPPAIDKARKAPPSPDELVALRRVFSALDTELRELKAGHASIEDRRISLMQRIGQLNADVGSRIDGKAVA